MDIHEKAIFCKFLLLMRLKNTTFVPLIIG